MPPRRALSADVSCVPPPARRRRKDARPAELIEAGLQEFALHGFAGTRLDDVAKRAGVVKGTIYRYFENKEALFEAAVRSLLPHFSDPLDPLVDSFEGSTQALMAMLIERVYKQLLDSPLHVLLRIVVSEGATFPRLAELYYRSSVARGRPVLEKVIARGVARGEVHPDHAAMAPLMIVAPAFMALWWKFTFDPFEPLQKDKFLAAHIELVCRGLLVRGRARSRASTSAAP